MKKDDILRVLEENRIQAFEVETGLDVGCDILLKDCSLNKFTNFCHSIGKEIAFYEVTYIGLEDYIVDEHETHERIERIISSKLESCYFGDIELSTEDFKEEINQKMQEICKHNSAVVKRIAALNEAEVWIADVYVIYDGVQVGVRLTSEYMDDYPMAFEIEDALEESVTELISDKISRYEVNESSHYERLMREMEEQRNQEKEQRKKAMTEIEEFIEEDTSLLECTNQKLRHAYAKQIAEEYSTKFDVAIRIGDVEVIADKIYKRLK